MAALTRLETPGLLRDLDAPARQAWSDVMAEHLGQFAMTFPQFYDPTATSTPADLPTTPIVWSAFPATLLAQGLSDVERWAEADRSRDRQDEYCEWVVRRDPTGKLLAVTFSTELPEYWQHVAENDPATLLVLYQDLVSPEVRIEDLFDASGDYLRDNQWNSHSSSGISHLRQGTNTLLAAIKLVADATILRVRADGTPIVDRQELVRCSQMGEPLRNSDPQIAEVVNDAASTGASLTLADPLGLYLDGLQSGGIVTPDADDAADFWIAERGSAGLVVRASLEVPPDRDFVLGDCTIGGRPLQFGAQVADKVRVRIAAFAKPGGTAQPPKTCV